MATDPLQVAVARLLGYRWPAETDPAMELAAEARAWIARCEVLAHHVDDDGIACLPSGARRKIRPRTPAGAADRRLGNRPARQLETVCPRPIAGRCRLRRQISGNLAA
jgi:hypothetical protein